MLMATAELSASVASARSSSGVLIDTGEVEEPTKAGLKVAVIGGISG